MTGVPSLPGHCSRWDPLPRAIPATMPSVSACPGPGASAAPALINSRRGGLTKAALWPARGQGWARRAREELQPRHMPGDPQTPSLVLQHLPVPPTPRSPQSCSGPQQCHPDGNSLGGNVVTRSWPCRMENPPELPHSAVGSQDISQLPSSPSTELLVSWRVLLLNS